MYGEKIKAKRRELNLSQEDLADKLFVTRQAISKWENDKATPTMTNLRELSEIFGVDMAYFIGKAEEEKKEVTKEGVEERSEDKRSKKKILGDGLWDIFIYACLCGLGIFFFAVYYFFFVESYLGKDPKDMPYLILTIYMIVALIAFPQAYKDIGDKLDDLEYNLFSKVVLPLVYLLSPLIVFYHIIKNKN
ncbi:helix-turn-helix domain-containing protein [Peptoniphilus vaginalis]|uniref:helix-turn-helix domain-containing protein n=1 Tax=Peptoniphilus vaginalis TaxID=1756987 RepID=UPI0023F75096|nr:helix-turn-helix transcriptional regulator [Peptoniphilus vaginalis]